MRALGLLLLAALPMVTFVLGRMSADRQPGDNHQQMAMYLARLLEVDNLTAILSRDQQTEARDLVSNFYKHNDPKGST